MPSTIPEWMRRLLDEATGEIEVPLRLAGLTQKQIAAIQEDFADILIRFLENVAGDVFEQLHRGRKGKRDDEKPDH